jgi:carboxylesterase
MDAMRDLPARGDPAPFVLEGGPVGVVMVHGFTGSPAELRPVAEALNRRGMTVYAPLLPGHGTTPEEINRCRWQDWAAAIGPAHEMLKARCETVFIAGFSLGSLLTLNYAAGRDDLPGIVVYSPALGINDWRQHLLPVLRFFVKTVPSPPDESAAPLAAPLASYDVYPIPAAYQLTRLVRVVNGEIARVTCPILIIYSTGDTSIRLDGPQRLYDGVGSRDKALVTLHDSGHVITADREHRAVAARTYEFIAARTKLTTARAARRS